MCLIGIGWLHLRLMLIPLMVLSCGAAAFSSVTVTTVDALIERLRDASVDRIVVSSGRYTLTTAALNVSRGVTIEAQTPGTVEIDAGTTYTSLRSVMIINPSNVADSISLIGLNLTGADAANDGGGVSIRGGSVLLSSCNIYSNTALRGGGISIDRWATVTLSRCRIFSNFAQHGGGAMVSGGEATLSDCSIYSNRAFQGQGGGVMIQNGSVALSRSTVDSNHADSDGGGIFVDGGDVSMNECSVRSNVGSSYGLQVRPSAPPRHASTVCHHGMHQPCALACASPSASLGLTTPCCHPVTGPVIGPVIPWLGLTTPCLAP